MSFVRAYVPPDPENVRVGSYVLCKDCSRGIHTNWHSPINRCQCDLCTATKEETA